MRNFSKTYKEDLDIAGKKAVELGELTRLGIPIPDGFVISTNFFKNFLEQTGISEKIKDVQKLNHPSIAGSIEKLFEPIKQQIMHAHIPKSLTLELHKFYKKHAGLFNDKSLNIFSSSPKDNKSIMFENVKGDANFILKIKEIWASQVYKPIAIVVQKNINSKIKGKIITNAPLIDKKFADLAYKIQKHFYFPKVVDYIIEKNKIYVTAIKPFTGFVEELTKIQLGRKIQKLLIKGISINPGIVTGPVKILSNNSHAQIKNGEIIILSHLNKSLYEKIKKAKGIIIDDDLLSSYDRTLYRKDIKIPTIIRTRNAVKILQNGNIVTVNGENGEIYSGGLI